MPRRAQLLVAAIVAAVPSNALAAPGDAEAARGRVLAKQGEAVAGGAPLVEIDSA